MKKIFVVATMSLLSMSTFAVETLPSSTNQSSEQTNTDPVTTPESKQSVSNNENPQNKPELIKEEIEQPRHIISISTDGFGWSGLAQVFNWDKDDSNIDSHETTDGEIKLNYNYVLATRFMIGAELISETSTSEIKNTLNQKIKSESKETEFGISLGYNFHDDLLNSWWTKISIGSGSSYTYTKDSTGSTDEDIKYGYFGLALGKRFNLKSWGTKNISYNPTISIKSASFTGSDAKDVGLESAGEFKIDLIKIDILF